MWAYTFAYVRKYVFLLLVAQFDFHVPWWAVFDP